VSIFVQFAKRIKFTRKKVLFSFLFKSYIQKYKLVNYKQWWIFKFLIQRPLQEYISDDSLSILFQSQWKYSYYKPINWTYLRRSHAFTMRSTDGFCDEWFLQIMKINWVIINKPLSGLLVCRLIISLAEKLSSNFHICPRSFTSRPNVFSDHLSAKTITSQHTSCLKGFYLLNIQQNVTKSDIIVRGLSTSHYSEFCTLLQSSGNWFFLLWHICISYWPSERSRWLDIGRVLFLHFYKNAKRERLRTNPAISTEQAWSIKDLLYGIKSSEKMIFILVYFRALKRKPVKC